MCVIVCGTYGVGRPVDHQATPASRRPQPHVVVLPLPQQGYHDLIETTPARHLRGGGGWRGERRGVDRVGVGVGEWVRRRGEKVGLIRWGREGGGGVGEKGGGEGGGEGVWGRGCGLKGCKCVCERVR